MKILTFPLAGPLQSWGDGARWDNRFTASIPSKSAVIGLLGCCLGYARGDERLRTLSERLCVAVRADNKGQPMWDFQTVQNPFGEGYILNSEGKKRTGAGGPTKTLVTPKQYLQDAAFQVFIFGDEEVLIECYTALQHPHWPVYLGRRSCVPGVPVWPVMLDEYPSIDAAVERYFDPNLTNRSEFMECQIEATDENDGDRTIVRMDEVIRADLNQYGERSVRVRTVKRSGGECI